MLVLLFLARTRAYPNIGCAKSLHSFTRVLNAFFYSGLWVKAICTLPSPILWRCRPMLSCFPLGVGDLPEWVKAVKAKNKNSCSVMRAGMRA